MFRRRFLEILATASALAGASLSAFRSRIAQAASPLPASRPSPPAAPSGSTSFTLAELLTRRTVPLGTLKSRRFYVSLDDIPAHWYPAGIMSGRNALVISAYEEQGAPVSSALVRAVLEELRTASAADYRNVSGQLAAEANLNPERVLLPLQLSIPRATRDRFPVDHLLAVIFEKGSSGAEGFEWVDRVFEVAGQRRVSNLIVPCLGRNWKDRHSIEFGEFFPNFLHRVPPGRWPSNVYMSLYAEWPSFEIEDAAKALDWAWKKSLA